MSTAQRVIKNTIWLYARMAASILVNIFTTRILLQALGASDYGLYNVVGGAITMLGFLTASMSTATQRFISYAEGQGDRDRIKEIFNNAQLVHYGVAAVTALLLIAAAFVFFNGVLNIPEGRETVAMGVYTCMVFSTVFSITIVPYDALLNAHENMRFYSIAGICDVLFKFVIALIVMYADTERLMLYAILMATESWLLRAITKYYCTRHYEESRHTEIRRYYNKNTVKQITSFAGWNLVNISSAMVSLHGTNIIINHFFGTEINAALGIATQLSGVLMGISANLVKAITPILVKSEGAKQKNAVLNITYKSCKLSFLLLSFFCIPIVFFINPILNLWLHNVPPYTAFFCLIMLFSALIDQIGTILYQTISANGDIKKFSIAIMIPNIFTILATFIMFHFGFAPYWGLINWLIYRTIIGGVIRLYYSHKISGISIPIFNKNVILPLISAIVPTCIITSIIQLLNVNWIIAFIISIIVNIPIYWLVGLTNDEKKTILNIIQRK